MAPRGPRFFLMGCWNNDNCARLDPTRPKGIPGSNDGRDYRRAVIEDIATRNYTFGLVAGDNIYPRAAAAAAATTTAMGAQKGPILKHYYSKTLAFGFGLLNQLNIPYYTVLGNHDVVKGDVLKGELGADAGAPAATIGEMEELIPGKLRLIRIDTNVLQLELTEPTKRLYGIRNAAEGWRRLKGFFRKVEEAGPYKGWTLVMGHEPLVSLAARAGTPPAVMGVVYYKDLLETLLRIPNTVYVCADYHAFQVSQLKLEGGPAGAAALRMLVVGTGGANPDKIATDATEWKGKGIHWKILESQPAFGHCEGRFMRGSGGALEFLYHPLKHCSPGQTPVRVIFRKDEAKSGKRIEVRREAGKPIPYDLGKCAARPTLPELCSNRPSENPRLEGVGHYVRRPYKIM